MGQECGNKQINGKNSIVHQQEKGKMSELELYISTCSLINLTNNVDFFKKLEKNAYARIPFT